MAESDLERTLAFQMRALKLPEPGREVPVIAGRGWRFDFAWPEHMLAVEVDGGTWKQGRHSRGAGYEEDCIKLAEAILAGWRVLRFTSAMVDDGRAVALVERAFASHPVSAYPGEWYHLHGKAISGLRHSHPLRDGEDRDDPAHYHEGGDLLPIGGDEDRRGVGRALYPPAART